jgi:hypothetical protein
VTKDIEIKGKYIFLVLFLLIVIINNMICLFGPIVLTK